MALAIQESLRESSASGDPIASTSGTGASSASQTNSGASGQRKSEV